MSIKSDEYFYQSLEIYIQKDIHLETQSGPVAKNEQIESDVESDVLYKILLNIKNYFKIKLTDTVVPR